MGRISRGSKLGGGAIALCLAYALILQGVFYAMGVGLAASPTNRLVHVLCTPGITATQDVPSDPTALPECCIIACAAVSPSLPPPDAVAVPARSTRFATVHVRADATPAASLARSVYPLGARAPPVLS